MHMMFISWSLITCILCSTLGEPLCHFFIFHPFSQIPNMNLCSDDPTSYGKTFTTAQTFQMIGSSIASPFWFNLSTRNRLFYFWFLPFSRILRMGYRASVYCNMFFQGAKPWRCRSFRRFGQHFPQCNNGIKTLWFSYLMRVSLSIQAFIHFRSIFRLLRIELEFFPIYKRSFSKSFDPKLGLPFFSGDFFKISWGVRKAVFPWPSRDFRET